MNAVYGSKRKKRSYDFDEDGEMESMTEHGTFKTTGKAFDKAIKVYLQKKAA